MNEHMLSMMKQVEENPKLWDSFTFVQILSSFSDLPYEFILKHKNTLNWDCVCTNKHLSNDFMSNPELKKYIRFDMISSFQRLTEKFIDQFKKDLDWYNICRCQEMSEQFIYEHLDYINWNGLISNNKFHPSEEFWRLIFACYPSLQINWSNLYFSKNFIREFRNRFINLIGRNINSYHKRLWKEFSIEKWEHGIG